MKLERIIREHLAKQEPTTFVTLKKDVFESAQNYLKDFGVAYVGLALADNGGYTLCINPNFNGFIYESTQNYNTKLEETLLEEINQDKYLVEYISDDEYFRRQEVERRKAKIKDKLIIAYNLKNKEIFKNNETKDDKDLEDYIDFEDVVDDVKALKKEKGISMLMAAQEYLNNVKAQLAAEKVA